MTATIQVGASSWHNWTYQVGPVVSTGPCQEPAYVVRHSLRLQSMGLVFDHAGVVVFAIVVHMVGDIPQHGDGGHGGYKA